MEFVEPTTEELAEEQSAANLPSEDDVRAEIIKEYEFDEDADKDRIEKLTKKEMDQRTKLSKAIAAKIKHRTAAKDALTNGGKKGKTEEAETVTLSPADQIAINRSNVHEDDLDEILDYAKYKKITVKDALKTDYIKSALKEKDENRKAANATAIGGGRRGSARVSDEELANNLGKGDIPEDPEALRKAILKRKGIK